MHSFILTYPLVLSAYRMDSKWLFEGRETSKAPNKTRGPVGRVGARLKAAPWGFITCHTIAIDMEDRVAR